MKLPELPRVQAERRAVVVAEEHRGLRGVAGESGVCVESAQEVAQTLPERGVVRLDVFHDQAEATSFQLGRHAFRVAGG